ncbi:MAG: hypothetical protein QXG86_03135 [Candidatus Woesearchaeota archaeon]
MIDRKEFDSIKKEIEDFDEKRDRIIKDSRNVLKLSKMIIYSLHREELNKAEKYLKSIKEELSNLKKHAKKNPELLCLPSYKVAFQEYVEAAAYFHLLKSKRLITRKELGVSAEQYILGVCDLIGELVRKAVNSAIRENYKTAFEIREFVSEIYALLLGFDFRNGELRKKFDSIKYELKKLDEIVLDLKLKEKTF